MATKKKKDSITLEMPGTIGSAKIILPETTVVKGSHLTITYDANNYPIKLEWDDEALMADVRNAILKAESNIPADMKPNVKAKVLTQKKKKEAAMITASKKSKTK
jgi:hypothetical protein